MKPPCARKRPHRHTVVWTIPKGHQGALTDRCRSLHLWSSLAFHVLVGDATTLDGKPYADRAWAEEYLLGMEADPRARATAKKVRATLRHRGAE